MIEVRNIHKAFGEKTVLNGIDLSADAGQAVTLIGPSGTGKTTLLRCINLLDAPAEGSIEIDGVKVTATDVNKKNALALRRKTAMVFQQYNLFRNQTVLQNVIQPQVLVKKTDKKLAEQRAFTFLEQVGVQDLAKAYPSQLSGGQQQRVSIARALALDPKVILFDEPTSALDPELSREVLNSIRKVKEAGIAIILATHEMQFAEEISDEVIFMEKGQIVESGSSHEIFHQAQSERTQAFLSNYSTHQQQVSAQITNINQYKAV